jgi:hypothetical protein
MIDTLWDTIEDIFNKDDFRFTPGAVLKLLNKIEFPYTVSLFSNPESGEWRMGLDLYRYS